MFAELPGTACWQHVAARAGFEVAYFRELAGGWAIEGTTAAVEDGQTWVVGYRIEVDAGWMTRRARITGQTVAGSLERLLEADGSGHWAVDRTSAPELDGCLDVDLESSAMTNTLPVHRLGLPVGGRAEVPAAYVRAADLSAGRLEQSYRRVADEGGRQRYDYSAPAFGFTARLIYDGRGLVLDYPGIARRGL
jgi:hypothetical protein